MPSFTVILHTLPQVLVMVSANFMVIEKVVRDLETCICGKDKTRSLFDRLRKMCA